MPSPIPAHDVPAALAEKDPDAYRLLTHDLIPDVEVTFMIDGLTLDKRDLHQVTLALEAWLPREQAAVIKVRDCTWDADGRETWTVPVPGSIVAHAMEHGIYDEHVDYYVGNRQVPVDIHIEWDPRGAGPDEIKEYYR